MRRRCLARDEMLLSETGRGGWEGEGELRNKGMGRFYQIKKAVWIVVFSLPRS